MKNGTENEKGRIRMTLKGKDSQKDKAGSTMAPELCFAEAHKESDLPTWADKTTLADFLHHKMKPVDVKIVVA